MEMKFFIATRCRYIRRIRIFPGPGRAYDRYCCHSLLLWCICLVLGITFRNLSGSPRIVTCSSRDSLFSLRPLSVCHSVYAVGMEYPVSAPFTDRFLRHLLLFCCSGHSEVSQKKQNGLPDSYGPSQLTGIIFYCFCSSL